MSNISPKHVPTAAADLPNQPPAPSAPLAPADAHESIAGEEDPGAAFDLPQVKPAGSEEAGLSRTPQIKP